MERVNEPLCFVVRSVWSWILHLLCVATRVFIRIELKKISEQFETHLLDSSRIDYSDHSIERDVCRKKGEAKSVRVMNDFPFHSHLPRFNAGSFQNA